MKRFDIKSMFIGIITGSLLFGGIVGASTLITDNVYLNKYGVTVDGKAYTPTLPILNYAGSTYVPLKEFGTITGASVTFKDNTIVVKKPTTTQTPSTGTTTPSTSTSKLNGTKIEMEVGDKDSFYVDLAAYGSRSATVSISSGTSYVSLSKTSLTSSSLVNVTAKKAGTATIKVVYNNGYTDIVTVTVEGKNSKNNKDDEIDVEIDCYDGKFVYYIDLDEYDADEAEIYVDDDDDCIKVNKEEFTSNGALIITGLDEGEAEIEIEFDTDDIFTINVTVIDEDDVDLDYYEDECEDYIEIDVDDYEELTLDPDDYDADWATISIISGTDYISVSKTYITSEKDIEIDGDDEGDAIIQVTYSTGDIEYYYIEVND